MLGESAALGARVSRCCYSRLRVTRSCYVIARTIRVVDEWICDGRTRVVVAQVSADRARAGSGGGRGGANGLRRAV